jgi:hypothetical protein
LKFGPSSVFGHWSKNESKSSKCLQSLTSLLGA